MGRVWEEVCAILVCIVLGSMNSILSKIRADQLQEFDGLACGIMNPVGYMVGYWLIIYGKWRRDITPEMMRFMYVDAGDGATWCRGAHRWIIVGGLFDEIGQVCGFVAQPYVSIIASALLSQTSSAWNMCWSSLILHARYITQEFAGVAVALTGASLEVLNIKNGEQGTRFDMALLLLVSAAAPSLSFVLKEKCFRVWRGTDRLDVWVVASAAAVWSFVWAPPVTFVTAFVNTPGNMSTTRYFTKTLQCFANNVDYELYIDDDGDAKRACQVAWQAWLVYMVNNVLFNVSIYRLVRLTSALTAFVVMKAITPVAIALSLFKWPYIGKGTISPMSGVSLALILIGVAIFRHGGHVKATKGLDPRRVCCWPLADVLLRDKKPPPSRVDDTPLLVASPVV